MFLSTSPGQFCRSGGDRCVLFLVASACFRKPLLSVNSPLVRCIPVFLLKPTCLCALWPPLCPGAEVRLWLFRWSGFHASLSFVLPSPSPSFLSGAQFSLFAGFHWSWDAFCRSMRTCTSWGSTLARSTTRWHSARSSGKPPLQGSPARAFQQLNQGSF